jgi:hypothetical protein
MAMENKKTFESTERTAREGFVMGTEAAGRRRGKPSEVTHPQRKAVANLMLG